MQRVGGRPLAVAIVVVVAVLAGIAIVDAATSRAGDTVVVLGDSITALGANQIQSTLGPDYHVTINGHFGAKVLEQEPAAAVLAATHAKQVIINLGTNDVLNGVPTEQSTLELQQMVTTFRGADCIHLVTINAHLHQPGKASTTAAATALNRAISKLASANSDVDVIDWNAIDAGATDAAHPDGLTSDGVHPSDEGQRRLIDAYGTALGRCGRPWHVW